MSEQESDDDVPLIRRRAANPAVANGSSAGQSSKPATDKPSAAPIPTAVSSSHTAEKSAATKPVTSTAVLPQQQAAAKPAVKPEPSSDNKPKAKPAEKAEPRPADPAAAKPNAKVAPKPTVKADPKPAEPKPATKPEAKPAAPAAKPAVKAEAKPVVKVAAKPVIKPEPKPAAKPQPKPAVKAAAAANGAKAKPSAKRRRSSDDDDDDDEASSSGGDDDEEAASSSSDGDGDSDVPLSQRRKTSARASSATPAKRTKAAAATPARKKAKGEGGEPGSSKSGSNMWATLEHAGVLFPPDYVPHGVKMLYDGKPLDLSPAEEEVASMFAAMKDSDYCLKPVFIKNFFEDWRKVLSAKNKALVKDFTKCDFTPIYEYYKADREAKKARLKEDKAFAASEKKAREELSEKYKMAKVDGRIEPVGNFRVEPPGLFRGRGEHPRMGRVKQRIYPKDVVINIGTGVPIPQHPYPGQAWKEVRHDRTVTWLAYWKDTISETSYKYVFLGATSSFKADSDLAKYERARKLKGLIGGIRRQYENDWDSSDYRKRQMGVALYFLDKLALRAGHEKDGDNEADTVGCCTLKAGNVELVPPSSIRLDFLGKDSIRYENTVEVHPKVYGNMEKFKLINGKGARKKDTDDLFETFDANALNEAMREHMDGLSVKVFRTYNASITLDRLLNELETQNAGKEMTVDQKKADYDKANKEVAILCNHQRSVPKTHTNTIEKMQEKIDKVVEELNELEGQLKKDKSDSLRNKVENKKTALAKLQLQMAVREDLKTVALGTSKINYMDPRISVAWCKRNDVPIEKIFNKSLLGKFNWAMEVEPEFRF